MTFNSGDYTKDAVYVTANADANGKAMGTVVIKNGSDTIVSGTEVAKGTTLTLTATGIAADATADPVVKGTTFVKWSTGSTENPLNVVATGDPMSITAIFKENE
jgi:ABC-type Fe2+-enterobactin transport system substrate-binding protein